METIKLIWEEIAYRGLEQEEISNVINKILNDRRDTSDASNIIVEEEIDGTFTVSNRVLKESFVNGEQLWKSE